MNFRRINIEISNICNLKCSFCPEVKRENSIMSVPQFAQIMAKIAPSTDEVCLHLMGEPLGHPQLEEIVALCAEFKTPINLSTNGILLNTDRRNILLHPIFRQINFSVHSFFANFPGKDPTMYLNKLFKFSDTAAEIRPDLYINYRLWDISEESNSPQIQNLDPLDTQDLVRTLISSKYGIDFKTLQINLRRQKGYNLQGRIFVNFDSRFIWPSLDLNERTRRGTCHALSNHIGIHADGTVVPCCLDKEATINLGNIAKQDLSTILNSPRAQSMREGFAKGELREDLCRRCSFVSRFDRKLGLASPAKSRVAAAPKPLGN